MSENAIPVMKCIIESALRELSDAQFQQRVWIDGSDSEVSSMVEVTEELFGDSCLNSALENNAVTFSPTADGELRKLHSLLHTSLEAEAKFGTASVIASAHWAQVRVLAHRILGIIDGK